MKLRPGALRVTIGFLNQVIEIESVMDANQLLYSLLEIEKKFGQNPNLHAIQLQKY